MIGSKKSMAKEIRLVELVFGIEFDLWQSLVLEKQLKVCVKIANPM
jgi:hypothetical protein